MSKIYDRPIIYRIAKKYITYSFKRFYSEYIVLGKENIPAEGPFIFAPNHLNALMDALAVLSVSSDSYSTVFLARADMFRKRRMADFLTFAKIMPAFRIRDGIENLGKNAEIFNRCVEVLETNNAMGIMPEGNQELERKIRPLVKGIFRVAFSAQERIGPNKNVKITPVGIDFGSLTKAQSHIIINIGKPIEVADYMTLYKENVAVATNQIKEELRNKLENLVLHLGTEKHYSSFETITRIANFSVLEEMKMTDNTVNRFYARQEIGKRLLEIEKKSPELAEKLEKLCAQFENKRRTLNLHINNFDYKTQNGFKTFMRGIGFAALSPIFATGLTFNALPFFTPVFIRKKLNVAFEGFYSSIHYGISIITFPLFYLLQAMLIVKLTALSWWFILLIIPLEYYLGKWAMKLYKKYRKYIGEINFLKIKNKKSQEYIQLVEIRNEICNIVLLKD